MASADSSRPLYSSTADCAAATSASSHASRAAASAPAGAASSACSSSFTSFARMLGGMRSGAISMTHPPSAAAYDRVRGSAL